MTLWRAIAWKVLVASGVVLISRGGAWLSVGVFCLLIGLDYMHYSQSVNEAAK